MVRLAMVQMNPTVGDLDGNVTAMVGWITEARKAGADLVVFPELAVTGYPPEDLLLKPRFVADTERALRALLPHTRGLAVVVGYVARTLDPRVRPSGKKTSSTSRRDPLYNAAAFIANGKLLRVYAKHHLPNYGVFDENRYFTPGRDAQVFALNGIRIGLNICEDMWAPDGPTARLAAAGADLIVTINASPYEMAKSHARETLLSARAREHGVLVAYTNMVGGQDELVFDGGSMIVDAQGAILARAAAFEETLLIADVCKPTPPRGRRATARRRVSGRRAAERVALCTVRLGASRRTAQPSVAPTCAPSLHRLEEVYRALTLAIRDYVRKNGFGPVVIGLSGGVDSAITAALAVDALGAQRVLGLFMPSPFTSQESHEDVADLARRLGMECRVMPITPLFEGYCHALADAFAGRTSDTTEENLQARVRGNLLMAISNKFGHLVLTTGNKSEMSVGYATLYGDMAGGFAAIKDVPKTLVYELANWRNGRDAAPVIPIRILERAPTAELRANQRDDDSLPPYPVLDPILKAYVEDDCALGEIVKQGFDRATVARVIGLVDRSEYKRRQSPVGVKITHRGLGKDRRMPITNRYRSSQ
ncbi:MAG: NAD+ synthase [Nitrospiraceae bacterium]